MTHWRSLHAIVGDTGELPNKAAIRKFLQRYTDANITVSIYTGRSEKEDTLRIVVSEDDDWAVKKFAKKHADIFGTVGIGKGNDTGPGQERVQFYNTSDGSLDRAGLARTCPAAFNGLRIEHIK